jgi:transposase
MAAPYSLDLRRRVVAAFRSGVSRADTEKLFDVSESSVQGWWSRLKRGKGSEGAMPMGGTRPFALAGERERLLARIAAQPDVPLRALLAELHGRGVRASYSALWNIVGRAGISFKKRPARKRTGPPKNSPAAVGLAGTPGRNRPQETCVH